jgi:hypothetical protein
MKNSVVFLIVLVLIFVVLFFVLNRNVDDSEVVVQEPVSNEQPIGGERDENFCLGPAGYAFDDEVNACVRGWELEDENLREAARVAVAGMPVDPESRSYTVLNVWPGRCPGCFVVELEFGQEIWSVQLQEYEITQILPKNDKVGMTPEECLELGGEPLNTVGGAACEEGQKNAGDVVGFISPNICCVDEATVTNFEECIEAGNPAMESYPRQCKHGDKTFTEEISL